jgi:hypothetical protein
MKTFLLACALALPIAAPLAMAADGTTAPAATMECCNTTCPICDMPVDKAVKTVEFKPSESIKHQHAGIGTATVGFCSEKCHTAYVKDPGKYEAKIVPQWQKSKNAAVKGGH